MWRFNQNKTVNEKKSKKCKKQGKNPNAADVDERIVNERWPNEACGAPTHADIIEFYNFLLKLKNQRSGSKTVQLFYCCNSERNYNVLKSKSPFI